MSKNTEHISPAVENPGWAALLLICKDCRRRKDGQKHLKAAALAKMVKHQVKETMPGARIVLTTCLKLCPKKATSVAYVAGNAKPIIAAIKTGDELIRRLPLFIGQDQTP